jgi:hypothetical protein
MGTDISVVQGPVPPVSSLTSSDISVVQAPQPTNKAGKPKGKKAATSSTSTTTSKNQTESEPDDKKGRSRTYLEHEDIQLCNSWLEISEDPKKGTDQSFAAFWDAIAKHYATHVPNAPRSAKSLKNHWSDKIQKEVNKFVSCVNQVQQLNPSGTTSANRLTMAMSMYHKLYEKPFTMLGCYEVLINSPKWNDYSRGLGKKKEGGAAVSNKRKAPNNSSSTDATPNSRSTDASAVESAGVSIDSSGSETTGPPSRPTGRKRAKSDHAAELDAKKTQESLRKMAQAHSDIAEVAKKQSGFLEAQQAAMNRLADESIMSKDLSGASDMMRRYYAFEQSKIMARLEMELSALNAAPSNTDNATSTPAPDTSR